MDDQEQEQETHTQEQSQKASQVGGLHRPEVLGMVSKEQMSTGQGQLAVI